MYHVQIVDMTISTSSWASIHAHDVNPTILKKISRTMELISMTTRESQSFYWLPDVMSTYYPKWEDRQLDTPQRKVCTIRKGHGLFCYHCGIVIESPPCPMCEQNLIDIDDRSTAIGPFDIVTFTAFCHLRTIGRIYNEDEASHRHRIVIIDNNNVTYTAFDFLNMLRRCPIHVLESFGGNVD